jgi:hypothetical protein
MSRSSSQSRTPTLLLRLRRCARGRSSIAAGLVAEQARRLAKLPLSQCVRAPIVDTEPMAAFLVTGNPGSGETTLAEELSRRGLTAIDSDYVPRLCHYEDQAGNVLPRAEAPVAPDEVWLSTRLWVWSRARLQEVLKKHSGPVFICGIARNIQDVVDLFDSVFLLHIDSDTQEERLRAYDRSNPSSVRIEAGRQQIRAGRPFFEAELRLGAIAVDKHLHNRGCRCNTAPCGPQHFT